MRKRLVTILLSVFFVACVDGAELTLVYSGNLDGELEPCGCSEEGNFGGIKRRVTLLDNLRKRSPQLVAISSGGLINYEGAADKIKSDYILEGFKVFKYDAVGVQWRDLVIGEKYILNYSLPWVVSNWQGSEFSDHQTITRNIEGETVTISVFNWLDPESSPMKKMRGDHALVTDQVDTMRSQIKQAKAKQHLILMLTSLPLEKARLLPLDAVDILIIKSAYEVFADPIKEGSTLVLQPGSRGMRIAKLSLKLQHGMIKGWQQEIIPMPDTIADSPKMADWYAAYNSAVKKDYLERTATKKQQQSGDSPYAGEVQCQVCHVKQYKIWQDSQHALAFDDLESVGKSFDPDCLQCHTVGFDKAGGFIDFDTSSHLMAVQCESCHGAAKQHVLSAGVKPVANKTWSRAQMCGQCHTQPHSPAFEIDKYWSKIAH